MQTIIDSTSTMDLSAISDGLSMPSLIEAFAQAKYKRSRSERTRTTYRDTMQSFRAFVAGIGGDLDSDPKIITAFAADWAMISGDKGEPSAATFSQRLAIVSSFYAFCIRRGYLPTYTSNPISAIDRAPVQSYRAATYLPTETVQSALQGINRSTQKGMRDYVLLCLGLETGRRVTEIANLTIGDLLMTGDRMVVQWQRTKGGKRAEDELEPTLAHNMRSYCHAAHGPAWRSQSQLPLWISFQPGTKRRFGRDGITAICLQYFGTGKVHTLRHTTAKTMEDQGASLTQIQHKLGHESVATTARYLTQVKKAQNPYASQLANVWGFTEIEAPSLSQ